MCSQHNINIAVNRKEVGLLFLVFFLLGVVLYAGSFGCEFVFDDHYYIVDNLPIDNLANVSYFWQNKNRLLGFVSFALNYQFSELHPLGYRLTNVGLHALSATCCFLFTLCLLQTPLLLAKISGAKVRPLAFFVALIFFIHPVQSETVAYVTQRFESIAGIFYFLTLYFYLFFRQKDQRYLVPTILAFIACLFCKETSYTLPGAILLVELVGFGGKQLKWRQLMPVLAALAILACSLMFLFYGGKLTTIGWQETLRLQTTVSRTDYFYTQLIVIFYYLRLMMVPLGLNLDHDIVLRTSLFDYEVGLALLGHCLLIGWSVWSIKKQPVYALALLWFYLTLSITSSIIPIRDLAFEHRMYLPLYGFCLAVIYFLFTARWSARLRNVVVTLWVLMLAVLTMVRVQDWQTEVAIWRAAYKLSPDKPRTNYNLATALKRVGREDEAREYLLKAASAQVRRGDHDLMGVGILSDAAASYIEQGDLAKALKLLRVAIKATPASDTVFYNLGQVFLKLEELDKAENYFEQALSINSCQSEALNGLGVIAVERKDFSQALARFTAAVACHPKYSWARFNLAMVQMATGQVSAAREQAVALKKLQRDDLVQIVSTEANKIGHGKPETGDYSSMARIILDRALGAKAP